MGTGPADVPGHHDEDRAPETRGKYTIFEEVRMIFTGSVGWWVGWWVGWLVGWLVGWVRGWVVSSRLLRCLLCSLVSLLRLHNLTESSTFN